MTAVENFSFPRDVPENWKYCARCGRGLFKTMTGEIIGYNALSGEPYVNVNIKCPFFDVERYSQRTVGFDEPWHTNTSYRILLHAQGPPSPVSLGYLER